MNNIFATVQRSYKQIINGIGFLPTIISTGLVLFAFALIAIQQTELGTEILAALNFIQLQEPDTARALLAALLAGIISLTVFSFSMVMVVVNQSASNYSPKVIEGFINKRVNQIILGIYIGTIIFIIIGLSQVRGDENFGEVPHFNLFTSIILMVVCIGLFILFIENISNSVRINNIVESIFLRSRRVLLENNNYHQEIDPDNQDWYFYKADEGGYFQSIAIKRLLKILKSRSLVLKVIPYYGDYLHNEHLLFCLNKKVDDIKLLNMIRGSFNIFSGENVQENYFYGFRQLREVAVKALSPGINDPGIAIICLDYLSELLAIYMDHETKISIKGEDGKAIIILKRHSFSTMINLTLGPIASYGKKDYLILCHILKVVGNLYLYDKILENKNCIIAHAKSVLDAGNKGISSALERACLNDVVKELNKSNYFDLKLLEIEQ